MWKRTHPLISVAVTALLLLPGLTVSSAVSASATTSAATVKSTRALPAPYSKWDVQVKPDAGNNQILKLSFNSPLLNKRITNTVYLPDGYNPTGQKSPVMYALHGTVLSPLDNCALNDVTSQETLVRLIGCGGGHLQNKLYDIPSQLSRMKFALVAPDTDPKNSIVETAPWINGRRYVDGNNGPLPQVHPITAKQVPADSFLHQELYPLVETLFNVRSDRGGRGVMGFSAGGWAATLQGMIHPDDYSYIGYVSGGYDIYHLQAEPLRTGLVLPFGYLRDAGYGTYITDPVWWQQYNPMNIATNIRGADTKFFLSSGSGCLKPAELLAAKECQGKWSPARGSFAMIAEILLSQNRQIAIKDLRAKKIPFQTVGTPGTHGANNADIFSKYIVPTANAKFASVTRTPETFSYRSAIPNFSVWGYDVNSVRPDVSFVSLKDARTDARSFTIEGDGSAGITTPRAFTPGKVYTVTAQHGGQTATKRTTANTDGRLKFKVDLEAGKFGSANTADRATQNQTTTLHISG